MNNIPPKAIGTKISKFDRILQKLNTKIIDSNVIDKIIAGRIAHQNAITAPSIRVSRSPKVIKLSNQEDKFS